MGGVDTLSRVLNPYSTQRKGIKWYRKLAELFVDICIYNGFIVWKKLNLNKKSNYLQFRKYLITELVTMHSYGTSSAQTGPRNGGSNPIPQQYPSIVMLDALQCSVAKKDTRYWCHYVAWDCVSPNVFEVSYQTKLRSLF